MGVLTNPKWERFAQELAKGKSASEAYVLAGYSKNDGNSIRLKGNEKVSPRVTEILERAAIRTEITIEKLTEMYLEDRAAAHQLGQIAAAKGAADSLAKLHGLWVDRHEHKNKYENMTDAELEASLARYLVREDDRPERSIRLRSVKAV